MALGDITAKVNVRGNLAAADFDGVDDLVNFGNIPNFDNLTEFSVEVDVRRNALTSGYICGKGLYAIAGTTLAVSYTNSNNRINCSLDNTRYRWVTKELVKGRWYKILVSYWSDNTFKIYVDNVEITGGANTGTYITTQANASDFKVGYEGSNATSGQIRNLKIWGRAYTPSETRANPTDRLILSCPFTSDYNDVSGNGLNGVASGSTIVPAGFVENIKSNVDVLNLAAVTDKIMVIPVMGRNGQFAIVGANRAAA